jgi:hypothetical protein
MNETILRIILQQCIILKCLRTSNYPLQFLYYCFHRFFELGEIHEIHENVPHQKAYSHPGNPAMDKYAVSLPEDDENERKKGGGGGKKRKRTAAQRTSKVLEKDSDILKHTIGPVSVSNYYKAPQLTLLPDDMTVVGEQGYRMAQATHGANEGTWYYEITIGEPLQADGHVRLGWATEMAELQAPVGYDRYSYSYKDSTGQIFHQSRGMNYGRPFGVGDVIGCLIHLPPVDGGGNSHGNNMPLNQASMEMREESVKEKEKEKESAKAIRKSMQKLPPHRGSFIMFFVNGVGQGKAFEDIWRGCYYPACSFFHGASATFAFGPDFQYVQTAQTALASLLGSSTDHHTHTSTNTNTNPSISTSSSLASTMIRPVCELCLPFIEEAAQRKREEEEQQQQQQQKEKEKEKFSLLNGDDGNSNLNLQESKHENGSHDSIGNSNSSEGNNMKTEIDQKTDQQSTAEEQHSDMPAAATSIKIEASDVISA